MAVRRRCASTATVPMDVHLMVQPVDALVERFAEAGADLISFHPGVPARMSTARCS
jgi:pentose-5-phosphate-3-epimerase